MSLEKPDEGKAASNNSFPWVAVFVFAQLLLFGAFFNPWVSVLRWAAIVILSIEALAIFLVALPIFVYQLVINRRSWRESLRIACKAILDILSFAGL